MAFARIEEDPKRGGYTVTAEDGSSFSLPASLFISLRLSRSQALSEEEYLTIQKELDLHSCHLKAVSLIARREHGRRELVTKLILKGFDRETADTVASDLSAKGLLDDVKFAYQFIISRQRRNPEGVSLLKMRLKEKGVSAEDIGLAVQQYLKDDDYPEDLRRAAERLSRKGASSEQLEMKLRKKGFILREIREALEG